MAEESAPRATKQDSNRPVTRQRLTRGSMKASLELFSHDPEHILRKSKRVNKKHQQLPRKPPVIADAPVSQSLPAVYKTTELPADDQSWLSVGSPVNVTPGEIATGTPLIKPVGDAEATDDGKHSSTTLFDELESVPFAPESGSPAVGSSDQRHEQQQVPGGAARPSIDASPVLDHTAPSQQEAPLNAQHESSTTDLPRTLSSSIAEVIQSSVAMTKATTEPAVLSIDPSVIPGQSLDQKRVDRLSHVGVSSPKFQKPTLHDAPLPSEDAHQPSFLANAPRWSASHHGSNQSVQISPKTVQGFGSLRGFDYTPEAIIRDDDDLVKGPARDRLGSEEAPDTVAPNDGVSEAGEAVDVNSIREIEPQQAISSGFSDWDSDEEYGSDGDGADYDEMTAVEDTTVSMSEIEAMVRDDRLEFAL